MVHEDGIFPLEMCQYCKVGYADLKGHQDRDCCAGNKPRGEPLPDFPMFEFRDKTVKVKEEKVHFFFFFFFFLAGQRCSSCSGKQGPVEKADCPRTCRVANDPEEGHRGPEGDAHQGRAKKLVAFLGIAYLFTDRWGEGGLVYF